MCDNICGPTSVDALKREPQENGIERTAALQADSAENAPEDSEGTNDKTSATATALSSSNHKHEPVPALMEQHKAGKWFEQLQHKIYCREEEEAILLRAYLSRKNPTTKSTPGEFCLISGSSGLGKSRLARTLQEAVEEDGGYFICKKFDQVRQAKPTRVFADAFSMFTEAVIEKGETFAQAMKTAICNALGDELGILTSAIPDIVRIVGNPSIEPVQMTYQLSERFVFALHDLIGVVCTPEYPMVIFFDDMQWAHPKSLRLLRLFTSCNQNNNLFIMGSCETDITAPHSPFADFIQELENRNRTQVFMIEVAQKPVKTIKEIIADSFPLEGENREYLAELVVKQTKGIPLFVLEYIRWLYDEELLQFDAFRVKWRVNHHNKARLVDESLGRLDDFWFDKMKKLPEEVKKVITCAACFGYEIDESVLKLVVTEDTLLERLDEATKRDILIYDKERGYSFRHEGLQMASLRLIPKGEEASFHLKLGRELLKRMPKEQRLRCMYVIVGQLGIGKDLISDPAEKHQISTLCLNAGIAAARESTFGSAAEYLNFGIDLLESNSWEEDYRLTYELFITAAEVHMAIANYDRVNSLVQTVLERARDIDDKISAYITLIYMEGVTGQQHMAGESIFAVLDIIFLLQEKTYPMYCIPFFLFIVDNGILVLKQLGEMFPRLNPKATFSSELRCIRKLVNGKSNEEIKQMGELENKKKLAAMQILNIMLLNALIVRPSFAPFIHLKAMEITMKHGLSPLASMAFAG